MSKDRGRIVWEKKEILKAVENMNDSKIDKFYVFMITEVLNDRVTDAIKERAD